MLLLPWPSAGIPTTISVSYQGLQEKKTKEKHELFGVYFISTVLFGKNFHCKWPSCLLRYESCEKFQVVLINNRKKSVKIKSEKNLRKKAHPPQIPPKTLKHLGIIFNGFYELKLNSSI